MSDPAWASRTIVDGHDSVIYVQAAGATATPGTGDELGFVTAFDFSYEASVQEVGPFVHYATLKKTIQSYSASGTLELAIANGTDAPRELFFTAVSAKSKLKLTIQMDPTTGVKEVFDQCIIGVSGAINPSEGGTYSLTFDSDTYTHSAASA